MLHATELSHAFDYPLFDSLNLEICAKESVSIMGPSGSGKSTLLYVLSTFLKPLGGKVEILGKDVYSISNKDILHLRRNELGIIFQSHYLFRGFSGAENLEVAALLSGEEVDPGLLESFGISEIVRQNVGELSGGQQQRLSIARVLTKRPRIIFADEPTGNLDKQTAASVMDGIFGYVEQNDAILLLATHDQHLAERCSRGYTLSNNRFIPWS